MSKNDTIKPMAKKTDYIQARMSPELKAEITRAAFMAGQPVTTFILLGLAKAYPELKFHIDRERTPSAFETLTGMNNDDN